MLGLDDLVESVFGNTPLGMGALAVAAVAVVGAPHAKPLAKRVIKGYLAATERVRELAAEATEQVQDLYAEAKYEYESQLSAGEALEAAESGAESPPRSRRRGSGATASADGPTGDSL